MAIEGPIRELGLIDLFQLLIYSQKSGVLDIKGPDDKGKVFLLDGSIAFAYAENQKYINSLLRVGKITKDIYDMAMQFSGGQDLHALKYLVDNNFISRKELQSFLSSRAEEIIYSFFKWQEGYFKFEEVPITIDMLFILNLRGENIIMEGSRRIDELSQIRHKIPHLNVVLSLSPSFMETTDKLNLKPHEWEIISLINGENTLKDIVDKVGNEFDTIKTVYGMVTLGMVEVKEKEKEREYTVDDIKRMIENEDYEKSIECLEEMVEEETENMELIKLLGYAYFRSGEYRKCVNLLLPRLATFRNDAYLIYLLSMAQLRCGNLEDSLQLCEFIINQTDDSTYKLISESLIPHLRYLIDELHKL